MTIRSKLAMTPTLRDIRPARCCCSSSHARELSLSLYIYIHIYVQCCTYKCVSNACNTRTHARELPLSLYIYIHIYIYIMHVCVCVYNTSVCDACQRCHAAQYAHVRVCVQKKITKNNTSVCDACQQCHAGLRQDSSSPI